MTRVLEGLQPPVPAAAPLVRRCSCGGIAGPEGECAQCRARRLLRKRAPTAPVRPPTLPGFVDDDRRSAGRPLEPAVRREMETALDHDFSRVRVHTDARAAESARAVGALAYTVGSDIVFDSGRYAPASRAGKFVLAHELAHVVQQGRGSGDNGGSETTLERDADQAASAVGVRRARVALRTTRRLQRLCPTHPTGLGHTPAPESCERAPGEVAPGTRLEFCQDSAELVDGQELVLARALDEARGATRVVIHGYASTEGPTAEYNYTLSCHRADAIAARFRGRGITVRLVMHGPISAYPVAARNRAVIVHIDRPAAPPAPPTPSPQAQAASLADADCTEITRLYNAHRLDTIGLFLQIYRCLTCAFPAAIRAGTFEDSLWLTRVNHFAITRLAAAFSSPNADYQRAFSACRILDRCMSPDLGVFERLGCQPIFESGTGMLVYIQRCTEDVGGVHLVVDLRDALRSAGCAAPENKRDYARVIPFFQSCNRAVLSSEFPGGGIIAERVAIPRITEQRNAAWTNAGCP